MIIHHVYSEAEQLPRDEHRRVRNARGTWLTLQAADPDWRLLPFSPQATAKQIGDSRSLPFINDLLDFAVDRAAEDDAVVWTNLDCCLVKDAGHAIRLRLRLRDADCAYGHRIEVDDAREAWRLDQLLFKPHYGGVDLFAFRPRWWRGIRDRIPKMYVACEAFDGVLLHEMLAGNPDAKIETHLMYHERHAAHWQENRLTSQANLHNRAMGRKWCAETGRGVPDDWR